MKDILDTDLLAIMSLPKDGLQHFTQSKAGGDTASILVPVGWNGVLLLVAKMQRSATNQVLFCIHRVSRVNSRNDDSAMNTVTGITEFPLFYWQKIHDFSRTPWIIFQDLFRACKCLIL